MAYQALYRSYRPQTFASVAGQKHIVTTLQNAIKLNKVAHAYLFTGPRGTGKTTMAKIMAKALNCEKGPTIEPCNECMICQGINKGTISDVIEIDAASNNGVDEIRDLRDRVKYLPSECKYKVYIIDEVHMLSQGAFNALLKTLEEPPAHVVFILATTEPHKIPATILSRCQRFDFQAIDKEDIVKRLETVIKSENINVSPEAVDLISDYCDGGMRDALSMLDQSISFSTDDIVDESDVLAVSGNISSKSLLELVDSIKDKDKASSLTKLNDIIASGKEIPRIINDLIMFLRDMLLAKAGVSISKKEIYQSKEYGKLLDKYSSRLIYSYIEILNDALNNIKFTNQKRAYLELAILKMADEEIISYQELIDRVKHLEMQASFKATTSYQEPEPVEAPYVPFSQNPNQISNLENDIPVSPIEVSKVIVDDSFISINDIENTLNSGSKAIKTKLQNIISSLEEKNPNDLVVGILSLGKVVCANETSAVIVLQELSKCNRMMKDNYYVKALKYLNIDDLNIVNLYCIPQSVWDKILIDFNNQYKAGIKAPKLSPVEILVKKHVENQANEDNTKKIIDLFDKNIVKIEEE